MQPLVEDVLMWPAGSMSWNVSDMQRDPMALLYFALNYGTVRRIVAPVGVRTGTLEDGTSALFHMTYDQYKGRGDGPESKDILIEPYDREEKSRLYKQEVLPVLQTVFESREPFEKFSSWAWCDFIEFLTNLLWCSRKRMPFVIDLWTLRKVVPDVRDHLIEFGLVSDPRPINEIVAIIESYQETDLAYFEPAETRIGSALEIWRQIEITGEFTSTASEKRGIGERLTVKAACEQVEKVNRLVRRAVERNPVLRALTRIGKASVSVFGGAEARFATSVGKAFLEMILSEDYVPPVYCLHKLEAIYNYKYYPDDAPYYYRNPRSDDDS